MNWKKIAKNIISAMAAADIFYTLTQQKQVADQCFYQLDYKPANRDVKELLNSLKFYSQFI